MVFHYSLHAFVFEKNRDYHRNVNLQKSLSQEHIVLHSIRIEQMKMEQRPLVPVEIQAAICIRPLLKKEREDSVVLEAQNWSKEKGKGVALHPLPPKINGESIAPSAALILQTMSPDTIQTGRDEEYRFDHVFSTDANEIINPGAAMHKQSIQNQVYSQLGRPMALRAMEALVNNEDASIPRTAQLLVTMGSPGSGKSHVCWGPGPVTKRKTTQDGLILRLVDSFFGQFDRVKTKTLKGSTHHYALNLSFVQINQDAYGNSHNACALHDLFQNVRSSPRGSALLSPHVKAFTRWVPKKGGPPSHSSSSESLEESIILQQDPDTNDFHALNQTVQTCRSMEEARDAVQEALSNSRKLASKKRCHAHVLVQIQPVVLEKPKASARIIKMGGTIGVLDMAGVEELDRKCNRRHRSTASLVNRSDAHTALIHCLRSIQYNETLRVGRTPMSDVLDEADDDGDDEATKMSEITCSVMTAPKDALRRQPSFKKVPFPRHKLTMLLQPFFSSTYADETYVTLLMAASPGTKDYNEKKGLMQEIESFVNARSGPTRSVTTGLIQRTIPESTSDCPVKKSPKPTPNHKQKSAPNQKKMSSSEKPKKQSTPPRPKQHQSTGRGSEADDEAEPPGNARPRGLHPSPTPKKVVPGVFCDRKKSPAGSSPAIKTVPSMTYSDSSEEADENFTMPPPIAPPPAWKSSPSARYLESPNASAPPENELRKSPGFASSPIHPRLSDDDDEGIPPPPVQEHYTSTSTTSTTAYFRPMQHNFKKAVKMGKKQCGKVWEKMYNGVGTSGSLEPDCGPSAEARFISQIEGLKRRLLDSEAERGRLSKEAETLRRENESLRGAEQERDDLRHQVEQLKSQLQHERTSPEKQYRQRRRNQEVLHQMSNPLQVPTLSVNNNNRAVEKNENDSFALDSVKNVTPRSRAYADFMAPRVVPLADKTSIEMNENDDSVVTEPALEQLTPKSRAYADITAPCLPFSDNKNTYDRMYTSTTTTTTTTTTRPLTGNSLKAHMAKLSAKGPVVPSPAGSPWNKW